MTAQKVLTDTQRKALLTTLRERFEENMQHHEGITWEQVLERLDAGGGDEKLRSIAWMEATGGEPDVVGHDAGTGEIIVFDCAAETPEGRRNLCYDEEALASRKKNKPAGSAVGTAEEQGVSLLTEQDYQALQTLGSFDTKTSSWIATPEKIRSRGGALFGDRRFDHVFIYHNGAESYYGARGFRASIRV